MSINATPATIWGCADVADLLRISRAAITNYRSRYDDTPPAEFRTVDGREFWTDAGMAAWVQWHRMKFHKADANGRRPIDELRQQIERQLS